MWLDLHWDLDQSRSQSRSNAIFTIMWIMQLDLDWDLDQSRSQSRSGCIIRIPFNNAIGLGLWPWLVQVPVQVRLHYYYSLGTYFGGLQGKKTGAGPNNNNTTWPGPGLGLVQVSVQVRLYYYYSLSRPSPGHVALMKTHSIMQPTWLGPAQVPIQVRWY